MTYYKIEQKKCKGCSQCIDVCPKEAIKIDEKQKTNGYKGYVIDKNICACCGFCVHICPGDAITIGVEKEKK